VKARLAIGKGKYGKHSIKESKLSSNFSSNFAMQNEKSGTNIKNRINAK
jgi:hypothetical protein